VERGTIYNREVMTALKETFLKKYGVWEYILFIMGLIVLGRTAYEIIVVNFNELTWEVIAIYILFILLGALLVGAPKYIVDIARNRFKTEPKK
tara:strand:+ start:3574 stop:3852 length:279 start_codon:yes stop_codon:yes gene_type:complete